MIEGNAARELLAKMDQPVTPEKRAFLAECHDVYLRTIGKSNPLLGAATALWSALEQKQAELDAALAGLDRINAELNRLVLLEQQARRAIRALRENH